MTIAKQATIAKFDSKGTKVIASSSFHMDQVDITGFHDDTIAFIGFTQAAAELDISYTIVNQPDGGTGGPPGKSLYKRFAAALGSNHHAVQTTMGNHHHQADRGGRLYTMANNR